MILAMLLVCRPLMIFLLMLPAGIWWVVAGICGFGFVCAVQFMRYALHYKGGAGIFYLVLLAAGALLVLATWMWAMALYMAWQISVHGVEM